MAYPITANPLGSKDMEYVIPVEIIMIELDSPTYTWNETFFHANAPGSASNGTPYGPHNLYEPYQQTVDLEITQFVFTQERELVDVNHHWPGLGGFIYIPSFPQLSRNETTWPHAT